MDIRLKKGGQWVSFIAMEGGHIDMMIGDLSRGKITIKPIKEDDLEDLVVIYLSKGYSLT